MTTATIQGTMIITSTNKFHQVTGLRVERILMSQEFHLLHSLVDNDIAKSQLPNQVVLDIYETNVPYTPEAIMQQLQEFQKVLRQHNLKFEVCTLRFNGERLHV